jgi:hypothetical protein
LRRTLLWLCFSALSATLMAQTGQFVQAPQYPVDTTPEAVAVGDFNGDGKLDVAAANSASNTVSILLGNGNGTFVAKGHYSADSAPQGIATGDFNGDGNLDVAVTNSSSNTVSVFLGNGDGTFQSKVDFATGNKPWGISVADLNGDGIPDVVVTNAADGTVGVFLGQGTGASWTLAKQAIYNTGSNPSSVAIGDVNNDGIPDLAVANDNNFSTVSVFLGVGNGTFQPRFQYATAPGSPISIGLADFNGDNKLDIVVAVGGKQSNGAPVNAVSILLGDGNGDFQTHVDYPTGSFPTGLAVGDFNGDGNTDVAVTNGNGNTLTLLGGVGNGTFGAAVLVGTGDTPCGVAAGDFNNSGIADLVVANSGANSVSVILRNGSNGTFQARADYPASSDPYSIVAADFNGDGKLDLAVGNYSANTISIEFGNGDGSFETPTAAATYSVQSPYALAAADFNGDGLQDLAVADYGTNNVSILLGVQGGTFMPAMTFPVGSEPAAIAVQDFNGDGKPDLAIANFNSNTVSILLGNGQGGFAEAPNSPISVGTGPVSVVASDLRGNGTFDLVVVNETNNDISILLGNGDGTFSLQPNSPTVGGNPLSVVIGDFNGDGIPDLAVADYLAHEVSLLLGNGNGTFQTPVPFQTGVYPSAVVAADFNGDGKLDLALASIPFGTSIGNQVSLLLGNGNGTFSTAALFGVGYLPYSLVVGDFNGDGALDLAAANSASNTVSVLLNAQGTTINLQSSSSTSTFGQAVTFTTTVAASVLNGASPTGTVSVKNGSAILGSGALQNGAFSLTTNALPAGADSISAAYSGNSNYQPHTISINQTVQKAETSTSVSSSQSPSMPNQPVTFTASVTTSANAQPTGAITFLDGTVVLGSSSLSGGGAAFTTGALSLGTHSITANYTGNGNFTASTSLIWDQIVGKASASVGLTATPASPNLNQPVTFTATITSAITTTPTGTMTFVDGTTQLGTAAVSGSGVATFSTSSLAAGQHSIAAAYSGDANFLASTSAVMGLAIAGPSFALSPSPLSLSVAPGASATSTIVITPSGGLSPSGVALSCSISPANSPAATCSLGPVTVANNTGSSILTVTAVGAQSALAWPGLGQEPKGFLTLGLIIPAILLGGAGLKKPSTRKLFSFCLVFLVLSVCCFEVACGSGSQTNADQASNSPAPSGNAGTPAGLYTITITGSTTSVQSQTATISLTVK